MSKLKMVQSLPSGGNASVQLLGDVTGIHAEVQKTNAMLAPLASLPEKLRALLEQDKQLREGSGKAVREILEVGKALALERSHLSSVRKRLENETACLRALEKSLRKSAIEHRSAVNMKLWHVVAAAVVAGVVVLNVEPAVAWLWGSKDAAQAQAWRELVTRASGEERGVLTQIRKRQQDERGHWK